MLLDKVRPLYDHAGPFITLHLDVSRDSENAVQQLDARWTSARRELEEHGIDGPILEQIEARVHEETGVGGAVRRTIVATAEEILLDDVRGGASSWPEGVTVGPLPDLAGWLSQVGGEMPFILVTADRVGADIEVYTAASRPAVEQTTADGSRADIRKLPVGGWAHDKIQQRAENHWHANAEIAADAVTSAVRHHRPRLVVVCGDVRARSEIAERLGQANGALVETVESGGRAEGTSDEALWDDVHRLLAELEARETDELVQRLERGVAVGEGVLTGPDRVADAFVKGEVERLVLDLSEAQETTIDPADHPGLALPQQALEAGPLPADRVLVAAAALTSAEVSVLPHEIELPRDFALANGVAATLRWDERRQNAPADTDEV